MLIRAPSYIFNSKTRTIYSAAMELQQHQQEQARKTVADKWLKPHGPPVGATFGARVLKDEDDVFNHNAWDHVTLPEDFKERAEKVMELHRSSPVAEEKRDEYNDKPAHYWDKFYSQHEDGFFKDRGWLRLEFPELVACSEADAGPKTVLEVGCGAGNTVFPLLMRNENPELNVYATDYSATAVKVVKANKMYPKAEHGLGTMHASVWDITSTPPPPLVSSSSTSTSPEDQLSSLSIEEQPTYSLPEGITPGSVDVISVIFVLSALHPREWKQAIHNLYTALKPGGLLLIRDYGRHDLAQLRIKKNRLLDPETPNLYIRGDGTRVYFFEKEELEGMVLQPPEGRVEGRAKNMFEIQQLGEDRRLLVNRKERLTMYRIWMQVKAKKLT
ncbi:S-adenosylmethionine-dependent methyltransferase, putative [Cryptococcus deneoformans JEC21]|uniref:tRNA N(3)-methylcytidine methyltransferase n=2 Tax=Cryptococcus deneoformans TaxID=40410 RepID=Q5KAD8_CRYD1|nr:S-adenosylmethionine-dependent methyltransferase, putative [Cryptococcus neoformans var. neoformans JEC21]AAW45860.2 S-adenosylmethionine-dependent methyltransferase, putative [Cryptococcus neoformans var. neoformans JEC21]